ncbi:MAG: hypothetical protein ACR652_09770 [Methylocystis sp.]|uniref:hypothetical protein n=1 Tax=Methylocystis sp. TaxID=1911079 RepID=UPI003DA6CB77
MTLVTNIDRSVEIEAAVTLVERFDWLDEVATQAPTALAVATKLAHRWIDKKLGGFIIGQETIAEKHGIPLRSVQRQMSALKAAGLLVQKRRYHKCPVTFLVLDPQETAATEPEINPPSVAGSPENEPAKSGAVNPPNPVQSTRQPQIGDDEKSVTCEIVSRDFIPFKKNPSAAEPRSGEGFTTATREEIPPSAAAAQRKACGGIDWPERRPELDDYDAEAEELRRERVSRLIAEGHDWESAPRCAGRKAIPVPRPIADSRILAESVARLMALPRRDEWQEEAEPNVDNINERPERPSAAAAPWSLNTKQEDRLAIREEVGRRCGRVDGFELDESLLAEWPAEERDRWMKGYREGREARIAAGSDVTDARGQ